MRLYDHGLWFSLNVYGCGVDVQNDVLMNNLLKVMKVISVMLMIICITFAFEVRRRDAMPGSELTYQRS